MTNTERNLSDAEPIIANVEPIIADADRNLSESVLQNAKRERIREESKGKIKNSANQYPCFMLPA